MSYQQNDHLCMHCLSYFLCKKTPKILTLFCIRHMALQQANLCQVRTVQYLFLCDFYPQRYALIKVTCEVTMTLWHSSWQRGGCLYLPLWSRYGYTFPMQNSILYHFPVQHHSN